MKPGVCIAVVAVALAASAARAEPVHWTRYHIAESATSVDLPDSIFTQRLGAPDGFGQRFQSSDGRADLTIQSAPNSEHDSPRSFLAKKGPPARIQYKRVTSRFFAVSSYRGDRVWYNRCNLSRRWVHCVLLNYPASEERAWDDIVTRISLSLRGG